MLCLIRHVALCKELTEKIVDHHIEICFQA
jgi:hypothetical protein